MLSRMADTALSPIPCPTITVKGASYDLDLKPRDLATLFQRHGIDLMGDRVKRNGVEGMEFTAKLIEVASHSDAFTWTDVMDECSIADIVNAGKAVMGNVNAGIVKDPAQ